MFQYSENFQGQLCFWREVQSCSKIQNDKSYIQYSETFQGKLCFSGQVQVAQKSWMKKVYSIYGENFLGQHCFSGIAQSCSKILNEKHIFNTVDSGQTLFLRESAKLLRNPEWSKTYIQCSEFEAHCFSGRASCSKILNGKNYIQYSENFQGKLCFSEQAQVAQKSWTVKKFSIQSI